MLTIAEIAKRLNIPDSTVRYWRNRFIEFIPATGTGRKMRYYDDALPVFKTIAEGFAEGLTATDIENRLSADFTRVIAIRNDNNNNTTTTDIMTVSDNVKSLNDSIQSLTEYIRKLTDKQQEIEQIRHDNEQLQEQIRALNQRIETIETKKKWFNFKKK